MSSGGLPPHFAWLQAQPDRWEKLAVKEWEDPDFRRTHGWKGADFVHSKEAAVHIPAYFLDKSRKIIHGARIVGPAHFRPNAESHKGLCHGGTMTALMDDVIGWTAFCVHHKCEPWSGFTVQVNTSLKAPVHVGAWLRVEGEITRREGRKVWVSAKLCTPKEGDVLEDHIVHCEAEGLVLLNSGDNY